jgi:hypothetical protein
MMEQDGIVAVFSLRLSREWRYPHSGRVGGVNYGTVRNCGGIFIQTQQRVEGINDGAGGNCGGIFTQTD